MNKGRYFVMKTIIKSKQLIVDPEKPPIPEGVVIIQDDRIVDVGPSQSIKVPQGCKLLIAQKRLSFQV